MGYVRKVDPVAAEWRGFNWSSGSFDTACRSYTELVEGTICTPRHLLLVTLSGGAKRLEVATACGHRYAGDERPGAVSFVPAHCERRLRMWGVESRWASISLSPALFQDEELVRGGLTHSLEAATFTNREDPFIAGLIGEFARLQAADGRLDETYCETMAWALARYLTRRYGRPSGTHEQRSWRLPSWRMRRIADYVDAHLDREIRIAELASLVGLSCGHLHRAFRASYGKTPLEYINERRIGNATLLLEGQSASIATIALRCGFLSPGHFARVFRRVTGVSPSAYRAGPPPP